MSMFAYAPASLRRLCLLSACFAATSVQAVEVNDQWDIGGALRARYDLDGRRNLNHLSVDTVILRADFRDTHWMASASHRFYGGDHPYTYAGTGRVNFTESAWVGYRFDDERQLQAGLNKIAFGMQPYFGHTFNQSIGNGIGLEDISAVGVKYQHLGSEWGVIAGVYPRSAWQGSGTSNGRTYALVPTPADPGLEDGTRQRERDLLSLRVTRTWTHADGTTAAGMSLLRSRLHNTATGRDGHRNALALHLRSRSGPWEGRVLGAWQDMHTRDEVNPDVVTLGGYDGTFNIAARGTLWFAEGTYHLPWTTDWLHDAKTYVGYSRFDKARDDFADSQRLIMGTTFALKQVWIALEWLHGRNDAAIGGLSYQQGLAAGGDRRWNTQVQGNIGYYF